MTTITLANGYTITTEIQDITIHDRVGFLDFVRVERRRVAQVWNADGVYEHGLALPLMQLDEDEATALAQIEERIIWLIGYYKESEEKHKRFLERLLK